MGVGLALFMHCRESGPIWKTVLAIEHQRLFAANHDFVLLHGPCHSSHLEPGASGCQQAASFSGFEASPPCQPWSGAARQNGLADIRGIESLNLLLIMRVPRVPWTMLENFRTIVEPFLRMAFRWSGFFVKWEQVSQLSKFRPLSRTRWLCLLLNCQAASCIDVSMIAMPTQFPRSPESAHVLDIGCSMYMHPSMYPPDEVLDKYDNGDWLPSAMGKSLTGAIQKRVHLAQKPFAPVMASYTTSHLFSDDLPRNKGLYGLIFDPMHTEGRDRRPLAGGDWSRARG